VRISSESLIKEKKFRSGLKQKLIGLEIEPIPQIVLSISESETVQEGNSFVAC
jgi:hypothetical protein